MTYNIFIPERSKLGGNTKVVWPVHLTSNYWTILITIYMFNGKPNNLAYLVSNSPKCALFKLSQKCSFSAFSIIMEGIKKFKFLYELWTRSKIIVLFNSYLAQYSIFIFSLRDECAVEYLATPLHGDYMNV